MLPRAQRPQRQHPLQDLRSPQDRPDRLLSEDRPRPGPARSSLPADPRADSVPRERLPQARLRQGRGIVMTTVRPAPARGPVPVRDRVQVPAAARDVRTEQVPGQGPDVRRTVRDRNPGTTAEQAQAAVRADFPFRTRLRRPPFRTISPRRAIACAATRIKRERRQELPPRATASAAGIRT